MEPLLDQSQNRYVLFPIQYDMLPDNITATQISGLTKIIG